VIRKLSRYILRMWHLLALTVACILIATYIEVYIPQLSGQVIRNVLEIRDFDQLISLVIQILVLTVVAAGISFVQRYANGYFSQKVVYEIRNDAFRSIQRQSFAFFDKVETGQLMSRATTDTERIGRFLGWQFRMLIESSFLMIGVVASMVLIDLELTILSFLVVVFMFVNFTLFGKKIRPVIHTSREHFGTLTSILWENITGIRVIRSFAREEYEKEKFQRPNRDYYTTMMDAVKLRSIFIPLASLIGGFVTVVIYWYGGTQVINNQLTIEMLFVFGAYASRIMRPMAMVGMIWTGYQRMAAAGERVFEVIDTVPEVRDKLDAKEPSSIKGHVVFEEVSFGYDTDRLILQNVNLEASPGETVALLGPTGSGKSTVIRLLPRFYDVTSGRILVDGQDVRDVKIESLRKVMGIVSQEIFLFNRTVKENIAYGNPKATMDDIVGVAKIARAHEFITDLPDGYDTVVGERGVTLSGGQQQRIAIARALLSDPRILILDDSTSSVDVDTEFEIQQALSALLENRTTFVITQRISTIRNADKIIVLENGKIIEEGTHESLMSEKGAYYRIYQTLYEAQKEVLQGTDNEYADKQMRTAANRGREQA
jgi:ABC-type multidrug transport system fused ATPase/permease subunit